MLMQRGVVTFGCPEETCSSPKLIPMGLLPVRSRSITAAASVTKTTSILGRFTALTASSCGNIAVRSGAAVKACLMTRMTSSEVQTETEADSPSCHRRYQNTLHAECVSPSNWNLPACECCKGPRHCSPADQSCRRFRPARRQPKLVGSQT